MKNFWIRLKLLDAFHLLFFFIVMTGAGSWCMVCCNTAFSKPEKSSRFLNAVILRVV